MFMFKIYKKLKLEDHNEDYAYELFPIKIKNDLIISFFIYDEEGKNKPHCHLLIWKSKNDSSKEVLYNTAISLIDNRYYHEELDTLPDDLLKSINDAFNIKLEDLSYECNVWKFLCKTWNFNSDNKHFKIPKKMPDYTKIRKEI